VRWRRRSLTCACSRQAGEVTAQFVEHRRIALLALQGDKGCGEDHRRGITDWAHLTS
jgi:hypothetical protein